MPDPSHPIPTHPVPFHDSAVQSFKSLTRGPKHPAVIICKQGREQKQFCHSFASPAIEPNNSLQCPRVKKYVFNTLPLLVRWFRSSCCAEVNLHALVDALEEQKKFLPLAELEPQLWYAPFPATAYHGMIEAQEEVHALR